MKTKNQFKVLTLIGGDWDDVWTVSDAKGTRPMRFCALWEAQDEIKDHCETCREAVKRGDMQGPADKPEDFRIVCPNQERNGWVLYPIQPTAKGGFVEDLKLIQSLVGSAMYETKFTANTYFIRRVS